MNKSNFESIFNPLLGFLSRFPIPYLMYTILNPSTTSQHRNIDNNPQQPTTTSLSNQSFLHPQQHQHNSLPIRHFSLHPSHICSNSQHINSLCHLHITSTSITSPPHFIFPKTTPSSFLHHSFPPNIHCHHHIHHHNQLSNPSPHQSTGSTRTAFNSINSINPINPTTISPFSSSLSHHMHHIHHIHPTTDNNNQTNHAMLDCCY